MILNNSVSYDCMDLKHLCYIVICTVVIKHLTMLHKCAHK